MTTIFKKILLHFMIAFTIIAVNYIIKRFLEGLHNEQRFKRFICSVTRSF